ETKPELMRSFGPSHAVALGVALIRAEQRHPVRDAEARVIADSDIGEPTLPDIGAIDAGDVQHLGIIRAEVISLHVLNHALVSDIAVQNEIGRKDIGMADSGDLDYRVAQTRIGAGRWSTSD